EDIWGGTSELFTMFSAPVGAWVTALVVLLLALFIVAIRWSLRTRFHAHAGWAWIVLPATYLVTGVLITQPMVFMQRYTWKTRACGSACIQLPGAFWCG